MTTKHRALITGLALSIASGTVMSAPWLGPGDTRARFAVQKLADQGNTELLVTTWPVMWGEVNESAESTSMARAYLSFEQREQAESGFRGEFSLQAHSQQPATDGFEQSVNAEGSSSINLQWQGNVWAAGLKTTYALNPIDDDELRLDGSYLAAAAGNWALGAGAIERWWGPGWRTSLILSNNTRPIESVWLNRNISRPSQSPLLAWLGPWHFTLLAGKSQPKHTEPDANLVAARFTFRPLPKLELGLSSAVIDEDDHYRVETSDNRKLTSLDFRYSQALGPQTSSFYAQALEEHGQAGNNTDTLWLLGTDWTTTVLGADQQWFLEYTNRLADDHRYVSELESQNSNGESLTMGMYHFFNNGANLGTTLTLAQLNAQSPAAATLSYGQEILGGWLKLKASASDEKIEYTNGETDQYSAIASWTYRF